MGYILEIGICTIQEIVWYVPGYAVLTPPTKTPEDEGLVIHFSNRRGYEAYFIHDRNAWISKVRLNQIQCNMTRHHSINILFSPPTMHKPIVLNPSGSFALMIKGAGAIGLSLFKRAASFAASSIAFISSLQPE